MYLACAAMDTGLVPISGLSKYREKPTLRAGSLIWSA